MLYQKKNTTFIKSYPKIVNDFFFNFKILISIKK